MGSLGRKTRFDSKWVANTDTGCHEWQGAKGTGGYGVFQWASTTTRYAHRASWMLNRGQIPPGLCVLHKCDNRSCVNPEHLFIGSYKDNADDMWRKKRGPVQAGERNPSAKLSEADVAEIRELAAAGATQTALAKEYGTTQPNLSLIINRVTWRHV